MKYLIRSICLLMPLTAVCQDGRPEKELIPYDVKRIARITGRTLPGENLPNPNHTDELYDLGGTDLGIAWEMGGGKTGFFFGDSYGADFKVIKAGGPGNAGHWRSNVLGISSDNLLDDGIRFDSMFTKKQIIHSSHIIDGTDSHTAIPTAAIHINGKDYVHYMDIRKWGEAGRWTTNFSALYSSSDQGKNWIPHTEIHFRATSNFAQAAYAKQDGYVYMAATISGRAGAVYLARFKETDMLNQTAYQYWNRSNGWVTNNEAAATAIIDTRAGELSIVYHSLYKQWIITYLSGKQELVMRSAAEITGPWSKEQVLATSKEYPGLYGAFIHPAKLNGRELYFMMSMWWPYNVFLMKVSLRTAE
ncbi:MAG TPA: DUF4185 domain-containing protein [Pedobacter sp.]|nr:DUF4185 domain-containing protein [Pedobacter sp.]